MIFLLLFATLGSAMNADRALHDCCIQKAADIQKDERLMGNARQFFFRHHKKATREASIGQHNVTLKFFPSDEMGYSSCPLLLNHEGLPKNATLWFTCRQSMSTRVMVFWCVCLVIVCWAICTFFSYCKRRCDRSSKKIRSAKKKRCSQKLLSGLEDGKNTEFVEEIIVQSAASTLKPSSPATKTEEKTAVPDVQKFKGPRAPELENVVDSEEEGTIYDYGSLEEECSIDMPVSSVPSRMTPLPTVEMFHPDRQDAVYSEDDELYEDYSADDEEEEESISSASDSQEDLDRGSVDIFKSSAASSRTSISSIKDYQDADEQPKDQDYLAPEDIPGPSSRFFSYK